MPEAAYTFLDESAPGIGMLAVFFLYYPGALSPERAGLGRCAGIVLGVFKLVQTGARRNRFVFALNWESLECAISSWSTDT